MNKGTDIIIPVYNAYEDLTKCIASIWRYTDLSTHRVIIVNDCSPDERISPYIHSIEGDGIVVIENEKNVGFSGSVNRGIRYSVDKDVLLLNSDTIVTPNWIEKILECAYSEGTIGTVTPLSNSATLASVPIAFQDNPIPENVTINEFADLIEKCSFCDYPRITVAVGFCMFIKREVLDLVGVFDEETFQRGYGEENDFCNRMELLGYKNALCDNTFVFHKGTSSFNTEEKKELVRQHEAILRQRYFGQMQDNAVFCDKNPQQYIRDNINIYLKLRNGKKNLLLVSHFDFRENSENNVGGIQYHIMDLTNALKKEYNVYVMAKDRDELVLSVYQNAESTIFRFKMNLNRACAVFSDDHLKELFLCIINAFHINLVHVHHVQGLTLDIFYAARESHVPIVLTLHDYYYICPNVKLVNHEKKFCTDKCLDGRICRECLQIQCVISNTVDYLTYWREQHRKIMELCDYIIAPSESTRQVYYEIYPEIQNRILVIEHGRDWTKGNKECMYEEPIQTCYVKVQIENVFEEESDRDAIAGWAFLEGVDSNDVQIYMDVLSEDNNFKRYPAKSLAREDVDRVFRGDGYYRMTGFYVTLHRYEMPAEQILGRVSIKYNGKFYTDGQKFELVNKKDIMSGKTNIAFFGGMSFEKGLNKINEVIQADVKKEFNWFIFGGIEKRGDILSLDQDNVYAAGKYGRDEIFDLIERYKIDLICILPVWAETFCYTLSEAYLCIAPVIVTDIGAVGERMKKVQEEFVVPVDISGEELIKKIRKITEDHVLLQKYKQRLWEVNHKSVQEMGKEYDELYKTLLNRNMKWGNFPAKIIFDGYMNAQQVWINTKKSKEIDRRIEEEKEKARMSEVIEYKDKEIAYLKQSVWYRISCHAQKLKIPFRFKIRNAIMKLLS